MPLTLSLYVFIVFSYNCYCKRDYFNRIPTAYYRNGKSPESYINTEFYFKLALSIKIGILHANHCTHELRDHICLCGGKKGYRINHVLWNSELRLTVV